jgi:hypothetical protein
VVSTVEALRTTRSQHLREGARDLTSFFDVLPTRGENMVPGVDGDARTIQLPRRRRAQNGYNFSGV